MRTYLISYDLSDPSANRDWVTSRIMAIGEAWARPLSQTWYVRCDRGADEIESDLQQGLGDDDGLVVQAAGEDLALANTALRWFRRRGIAVGTAEGADENSEAASAEILEFRRTSEKNCDTADLAA